MARLGRGQAPLSGRQFQDLQNALLSAYGDPRRFQQMLRFQLDKRLANLSLASTMPQIVFDVIDIAEQEGWSLELLLGARASNPGSPELLAFAYQFGLAPLVYEQRAGIAISEQPAAQPRLERYIVESNGLKDVLRWRELLGKLEAQVCRVEVPIGNNLIAGTGFLLGPSTAITNYHVIEAVDRQKVDRSSVILRFDYKQLKDGVTVNPGTEYHLATDWLIYSSLPSKNDLEGGEPAPDELDFALLRVDGTPGQDPVGGPTARDPDTPLRGWITPPAILPEFKPDAALFILQHPRGGPLKLALDTRAIIEAKFDGRRVRYRTNTEAGSSGSPCFDDNWNLVALHHLGDPDYNPEHKPLFNQGIPFKAILELLKEHDKDRALGT